MCFCDIVNGHCFQNREIIHNLFDIQVGRNFGAERFILYFSPSFFQMGQPLDIYSFCDNKNGTPFKTCRVVFIIEKKPT